ncbi:MAG: hypothetical protein P8J50_06585 [Acidimicrobiales bacterium]|jgi:hypothetical protein|nr:hypothetical protein [Acidimicrobiales bacterium]
MANSNKPSKTWIRSLVIPFLALVVVASACGDDGGSAAGGRSFCEIALDLEAEADAFDFISADELAIETVFRSNANALAAGIASAPNDQVKADLQEIAQGTSEMIAILEAAEWSIFSADPAKMDAITDSATFNDASDRVTEYSDTNCGTGAESDDSDDGDVDLGDFSENPDAVNDILNNPAFRAPMVEGMVQNGFTETQANCFLDNLSIDTLLTFDASTVSEDSARELYGNLIANCGISPDQFG